MPHRCCLEHEVKPFAGIALDADAIEQGAAPRAHGVGVAPVGRLRIETIRLRGIHGHSYSRGGEVAELVDGADMSLVGRFLDGLPGLVDVAGDQQRPPEFVTETGDIGMGFHRRLAALDRAVCDLVR